MEGNDWVMADGGTDHTFALKSDGSIWAWGYNGYGQLGAGNTETRQTPQRVGSANDWKYIAAAHAQSIAIKNDNSLWGWGHNISGQLGLGNNTHQNSPQSIGGVWTLVSTGTGFTIGLRPDGTLLSTGSNMGLASGDNANRNAFGSTFGAGWVYVSCGGSHTLAVGPGGTLFSWGTNGDGELGHGAASTRGQGPVPGFTVRWP